MIHSPTHKQGKLGYSIAVIGVPSQPLQQISPRYFKEYLINLMYAHSANHIFITRHLRLIIKIILFYFIYFFSSLKVIFIRLRDVLYMDYKYCTADLIQSSTEIQSVPIYFVDTLVLLFQEKLAP